MLTPAGASLDSAHLALVVRWSERFAQTVDFYQESPIESFADWPLPWSSTSCLR
jgi:hypothetical protein